MKITPALGLTVLLLGLPATITAQDSSSVSAYAGEETRQIKSLSEDDIAELRRGGGWGLAKAAELNGVPGPAHLLELKEEIPLTSDQISKIEVIYEEMKAEAIAAGERLIAGEVALENAFVAGHVNEDTLRQLLAEIETARFELRFIHLSRHLSTPALLSKEQITRYNELRGYGSDPCLSVPEGHDPAIWRKHNDCE